MSINITPPNETLNLIGHEAFETEFSNLWSQGNLPHAFRFTGQLGIGKATFPQILGSAHVEVLQVVGVVDDSHAVHLAVSRANDESGLGHGACSQMDVARDGQGANRRFDKKRRRCKPIP